MSVPDFQLSHNLPIGFGKLCLLVAVVIGLSLLVVPLTFVRLRDLDSPMVITVAVTMVVQSAVMFGSVYLLAIRLWGVTWEQLGCRHPDNPAWYGRAVFLAFGAMLLVALVTYAIEAVTGAPMENPQVGMLAPGGGSIASAAVMLFLVAVVAPIAEELLFRGIVYRWIAERFGYWAGLLVSSLIFSCMHGILVLVLPLFVVGCLLAWLYEKSGSILPCIVMHGVFNGIMLTGLYVGLSAGAQP